MLFVAAVHLRTLGDRGASKAVAKVKQVTALLVFDSRMVSGLHTRTFDGEFLGGMDLQLGIYDSSIFIIRYVYMRITFVRIWAYVRNLLPFHASNGIIRFGRLQGDVEHARSR